MWQNSKIGSNQKRGSHGHAKVGFRTPEYTTWLHMRERCKNPKCKDYGRYGGRGISVCERWNSFENFFSDMGDRPRGLTLERKDSNKNYTPENCKWASRAEQSKNKSSSKILTHNGKTQCASVWAEELGINRYTIYNRIGRYGWSIERALTTPV